eukprot:626573-Rhodomonas_salina.1
MRRTALIALLVLVCMGASEATAQSAGGLGGILTRLRGGGDKAAAPTEGSAPSAAEDAAAKAQA